MGDKNGRYKRNIAKIYQAVQAFGGTRFSQEEFTAKMSYPNGTGYQTQIYKLLKANGVELGTVDDFISKCHAPAKPKVAAKPAPATQQATATGKQQFGGPKPAPAQPASAQGGTALAQAQRQMQQIQNRNSGAVTIDTMTAGARAQGSKPVQSQPVQAKPAPANTNQVTLTKQAGNAKKWAQSGSRVLSNPDNFDENGFMRTGGQQGTSAEFNQDMADMKTLFSPNIDITKTQAQREKAQREAGERLQQRHGRTYVGTDKKVHSTNAGTELKIRRNERNAKVVESTVGKDIDDAIGSVIAEGEERGNEMANAVGSNNSYAFNPGGVDVRSMQMASAYNQELDPEKLFKQTSDRITGNLQNLIMSHADEYIKAAEAEGISAEDYVDKYVLPAIQEKLVTKFEKSQIEYYSPKSAAQYILRGLSDTIPGMLANMATTTRGQRQYQQAGDAKYIESLQPEKSVVGKEDLGFWDKHKGDAVEAGRFGVSLTDPAFAGSMGVGQTIGRGIGKVGGKVLEKTVGRVLATDAMKATTAYATRYGTYASRGMARILASNESIASRLLKAMPGEMIGQGLGMNIYGALQGTTNTFSTYSNTDIYGNRISEQTLGEAAWDAFTQGITNKEGFVSGAAFGATMPWLHTIGGVYGSRFGEGASVKGILEKGGYEAFSIAATGAVMQMSNEVNSWMNGEGFNPTLNGYIKEAMMATAMKFNPTTVVEIAKKVRSKNGNGFWANLSEMRGIGRDIKGADKFRFNLDEEREILEATGTKNLRDAFASIFPDVLASKGEATPEEVAEAQTRFLKVMNSLSWDTQNKIAVGMTNSYVLTRPRCATFKYVKDNEGRNIVLEMDAEGNILSSKVFKTEAEKDAFVYERCVNALNEDFWRAYEECKYRNSELADNIIDKVASANGKTVEEIEKILKKEPVRRTDLEWDILDNIMQELEGIAYPENEVHTEKAKQDGEKIANEADVLGENPDVELIASTSGKADGAVEAVKQAQAEFEQASNGKYWRDRYDELKEQGMENEDIYKAMIDEGFSEYDLEPLRNLYVAENRAKNAVATQEGLKNAVGQKIEEEVSKRMNLLTRYNADVIVLQDQSGKRYLLEKYMPFNEVYAVIDESGKPYVIEEDKCTEVERIPVSEYENRYRQELVERAKAVVDPEGTMLEGASAQTEPTVNGKTRAQLEEELKEEEYILHRDETGEQELHPESREETKRNIEELKKQIEAFDKGLVDEPIEPTTAPVAEGKPVAETPKNETPVVETPATEASVTEKPVGETPVAETPIETPKTDIGNGAPDMPAAKPEVVAEDANTPKPIPRDSNNKKMYIADGVRPIDAVNDIYNGGAFDTKQADDFVKAMIEDAEKELKKVNKPINPKRGEYPEDFGVRKNEHQEVIRKAQTAVDRWKAILEEAHKNDLKNEEKPEPAESFSDLYMEGMEDNPVYIIASLMPKITPESFNEQVGLGTGEKRVMPGVLAKKENGGVDIDTAVLLVHSEHPEMDYFQIRNIIIDILSNGGPRSIIKKLREDLQSMADEADAWAETLEWKDYDETFDYNTYRMTFQEYKHWEESEAERLSEQYRGVDMDNLHGTIAEEYQKEEQLKEDNNGQENRRTETGNKVLQRTQTGNQERTGEGTESTGRTKPGNKVQGENGQVSGSASGEVEKPAGEKPVNNHAERLSKIKVERKDILDAVVGDEDSADAVLDAIDKIKNGEELTQIEDFCLGRYLDYMDEKGITSEEAPVGKSKALRDAENIDKAYDWILNKSRANNPAKGLERKFGWTPEYAQKMVEEVFKRRRQETADNNTSSEKPSSPTNDNFKEGDRVVYKNAEMEVDSVNADGSLNLKSKNALGIDVVMNGVDSDKVRGVGSDKSKIFYKEQLANKLVADNASEKVAKKTLAEVEKQIDELSGKYDGTDNIPAIETEKLQRLLGMREALNEYIDGITKKTETEAERIKRIKGLLKGKPKTGTNKPADAKAEAHANTQAALDNFKKVFGENWGAALGASGRTNGKGTTGMLWSRINNPITTKEVFQAQNAIIKAAAQFVHALAKEGFVTLDGWRKELDKNLKAFIQEKTNWDEDQWEEFVGEIRKYKFRATEDGERKSLDEWVADEANKLNNNNEDGNTRTNGNAGGEVQGPKVGINETSTDGRLRTERTGESNGEQQVGGEPGTDTRPTGNISRTSEKVGDELSGSERGSESTTSGGVRVQPGGESGNGRGRGGNGRAGDNTELNPEKTVASDPTSKSGKKTFEPKNQHNYSYPADEKADVRKKSEAKRYADNIKAVEVLQKIISENRDATPEEREILAGFSGWGGISLPRLGDREYIKYMGSAADKALNDILTKLDPEDKMKLGDAISHASLSSYYTPVPVARVMSNFLAKAGFKKGSMLDPSMGLGVFEGTLPESIKNNISINGVELDWLTGNIAKALYPDANIKISGFEKAGIAPNSHDVVMSNIPFGDFGVADLSWEGDKSPIRDHAQKRIHNYFAVKMLESTKPGGLCVIMTSNAIMDTKGNKMFREYIADNAELVGAIRLPDNTFAGAGTKVVTDVIFLRKFRNETDRANTLGDAEYASTRKAFLSEGSRDINGIVVSYNGYFDKYPDMMIGDVKAGGQYRKDEFGLSYDTEGNAVDEIASRMEELTDKIVGNRKGNIVDTKVTKRETLQAVRESFSGDANFVSTDNIIIQNGKAGKLIETKNEYGEVERTFVEDPSIKKDIPRIEKMIPLRKAMKQLISEEINRAPDERLSEIRTELTNAYNEYVEKFGRLNDKENDYLDSDINGFSLRNLEKWKEGKFVGLSDIFTKKVIKAELDKSAIKSAQDVIAASLSEYGDVREEFLKEFLGDNWREETKDLLFEIPNSDGSYETKDAYLSGDVKTKLEQAKIAAETDERFKKNVEALEAVQPKDIPFDDITIHMGARWIPVEMYNEFAKEILGLRYAGRRWGGEMKSKIDYIKAADAYEFRLDENEMGPESVKWTTNRCSASKIFEAALLDKTITIKDKVSSDPDIYEVNIAETEAANDKVTEMREMFEDWLSQKSERIEGLQKLYNDLFNRTILREWDGRHLTIPGLMGMELRPHQKDAVWMLLNQRGGIVDHIVGAGKSLVMFSTAMEMRRMGIAKKPMIIGLKSTLGQLAKEFAEAFPQARILFPTEKDFEKKNRKNFLAKIAQNDYDCVIMSHENYCNLPHSEEVENRVANEKIAQIEATLEYMRGQTQDAWTKRQIKGLEKRIANELAKIEKRRSKRTEAEFTFEEMGIDYMFVDECQAFKNLAYTSASKNVAGLGPADGSAKSDSLLLGIRYLQSLHQGDFGTVFLSGTTLTNSVVEAYNHMNYLRPGELDRLGMNTFDAWASCFTQKTKEFEYGVTNELKEKTRFRNFDNLPELARMYKEIADVRNDENLKLPKPKMNVHIVTVPQTEKMAEINREIINMVKTKNGSYFGKGSDDKSPWGLIASDLSSKAALSLKLIDETIEDEGGKIPMACKNIKEMYDKFAEQKGCQMIFLDKGVGKDVTGQELYGSVARELVNQTSKEQWDAFVAEYKIKNPMPKGMSMEAIMQSSWEAIQNDLTKTKAATTRWMNKICKAYAERYGIVYDSLEESVKLSTGGYSAYRDIINRLVNEYGIPRNEVVDIHEAKTQADRKELFRKANAGEVRILIGGTKNMGTGVNAQVRLIAEHHLDIPWTPSDVDQRNGRGARQGNMIARDHNDNKVEIFYYATEGSLDMYKYQLQDIKGKMFDRFKMAALGERSFDEGADGDALDPAEVVAMLSGNSVILDKSKQDKLVAKLRRAKRSFQSDYQRKVAGAEDIKQSIARFEGFAKANIEDQKLISPEFKPDEKGVYPANVTVTLDGTESKTFDKPKEAGEYIKDALNLGRKVKLSGFGIDAIYGDTNSEFYLNTKSGIPYMAKCEADMDAAHIGTIYRSLLQKVYKNAEAYQSEIAKKKEFLANLDLGDGVWPKEKELEDAIEKQKELDREYRALANNDIDYEIGGKVVYQGEEYKITGINKEDKVIEIGGPGKVLEFKDVEKYYTKAQTEEMERKKAQEEANHFSPEIESKIDSIITDGTDSEGHNYKDYNDDDVTIRVTDYSDKVYAIFGVVENIGWSQTDNSPGTELIDTLELLGFQGKYKMNTGWKDKKGNAVKEYAWMVSKKDPSAIKRAEDAIRKYYGRKFNEKDNNSGEDALDKNVRNRKIELQETGKEDANVIKQYISDKASELNTSIFVADEYESLSKEQQKMIDDAHSKGKAIPGWYDTRSGKVVLYLPDVNNRAEAERTVLHEVVSHKGLRGLLGDKEFVKICNLAYEGMSEDLRIEYIKEYGNSAELIGDEYMASLSENGIDNPTLWSKIKLSVKSVLRKIGININLSDSDIKTLLWMSKNRLEGNDKTRENSFERSGGSSLSRREGEIRGTSSGRIHPFVSAERERDTSMRDIDVLEEGLASASRKFVDSRTEGERRDSEDEAKKTLLQIQKNIGGFDDSALLRPGIEKVPEETGESDVYIDRDNGVVYKIKNPFQKLYMKNHNPADVIYEHIAHNILFPTTKYTFEGLSKRRGEPALVLSQREVEKGYPVSDEEVDNYMNRFGFEKVNRYSFTDGDITITDVYGQNVFKDRNGELYFIDPVIKFNKPAKEAINNVAKRVDSIREGIVFRVLDTKKPEEKKEIDWFNSLNDDELVEVYRSMQVIEIFGKRYLVPPMSGKVEGEWQDPIEIDKNNNIVDKQTLVRSDERPWLAHFTVPTATGKSTTHVPIDECRQNEKGEWEYISKKTGEWEKVPNQQPVFYLDKTGKSKDAIWAAYNPYGHYATGMLNDQFSSAQDRDNLVSVRFVIPKSELKGEYKAKYAKDSTGEIPDWKAGVITSQLTGTRGVILSRWGRPVGVATNKEVADNIYETVKGNDIVFPSNVVPKDVRKHLEAKGVKFVETDNQGRLKEGKHKGDYYSMWYSTNPSSDNIKKWTKKTGMSWADMESERNKMRKEALSVDNTVRFSETLDGDKQSTRSASAQEIASHVEKVGKGVQIHESVDTITDKKAKKAIESGRDVKGYWDAKTNSVHLYMPNIHSKHEAVVTIIHESVGHKGLREVLNTEQNPNGYQRFMDAVWADKSNTELHEFVKKYMPRKGWDLYEGIDEWLAREAEKDITPEKLTMWGRIKEWFNNALVKAGFKDAELTINDVRIAIWLSKNRNNNPNDPLYKARKNALLEKVRRTKVQPAIKDGVYVDGAKNESRNSETLDEDNATPNTKAVANEYDEMLRTKAFRTREAFVDNMESLRILQELIGGKIVADHENAYLAENHITSIAEAQWNKFNVQKYQPVEEAINNCVALLGGKSKDALDQIECYIYKKHGLERNRSMYVRKALEEYANTKAGKEAEANYKYMKENNLSPDDMADMGRGNIDTADRLLEKYQAEESILYKKMQKGEIDFGEYLSMLDDFISNNINNEYDPNKVDYSGVSEFDDGRKLDNKDVEWDESKILGEIMDMESRLGKDRIDNIWSALKDATDFGIDYSWQSGQLDREGMENIKSMYHWYVPLRGFSADKMEDIYDRYHYDGGNGVGKVVKKAKGRISLADSPLATISKIANDAILWGERNKMLQMFYRLNNRVKNDAVKLSEAWEIDRNFDEESSNDNPQWEASIPVITDDMSATEIAETIDSFNKRMAELEAKGGARKVQGRPKYPAGFKNPLNAQTHAVRVYINGREKVMWITGDPRAAQALRGELVHKNNSIAPLKWLMNTTAKLATSYSPEFILSNTSRDTLFSNANIAAKEGPAYYAKFTKNQAIAGALMSTTGIGGDRIGESLFEKYYRGRKPKNSTERLFFEFMDNGGRTGFIAQQDVEQHKTSLKASIKGTKPTAKTIDAVCAIGKAIPKGIEQMNMRAELINRFATYMTSRQMGRSIMRSVSDAKEISVNFNRHGAGNATEGWQGSTAGFFRDYYMFFNAGMQSAELLWRNVSKNPSTAIKTVSYLGVIPAMVGTAFAMMMDDDDKYSNIPSWDRRNNICIPVGDEGYVKIPLPIELRAFWGMGDIFASLKHKRLQTDESPAFAMAGQISQMMPIDVLEAGEQRFKKDTWWIPLLPTAVRPWVENIKNIDWTGKPIQKDSKYFEDAPQWTLAYNSTPKPMVELCKWIHDKTRNGETTAQETDVTGIDLSPAKIEHILKSYFSGAYSLLGKTTGALTADEIDAAHFPMVSRLWGSFTDRETDATTNAKFFSYRKEYQNVKKEFTNEANKLNNKAIQELKNSARGKRFDIYGKYEKEYKKKMKVIDTTTDPNLKKMYQAELETMKRELVDALDNIE